MTENPWQRLRSHEVYRNPWIIVHHEDVITPGGSEGIYGRVSFRNLALGIIPVDRAGYTWLVGQYRYTLDEYSWEIPMGGGPHGIAPVASAQRELKEETGLVAACWQQILRLHTSNSVTDEEGFVYLATDLRQEAPEPEESEDLRLRHLPLQEAVQMALDSEITDAISVAGLLKAAHLQDIG